MHAYTHACNTGLVVSYTDSASTQRSYQFDLQARPDAISSFLPGASAKDTDSNPVEFVSLAYDQQYKARGRNCLTAQRIDSECSAWEESQSEFSLGPPPSPPTITSVEVDPNDSDRLVVNYTDTPSSLGFSKFQIRYGTSKDSVDTLRSTADGPDTGPKSVAFDGLDYHNWYRALGMNCRTSKRTNCGDPSGYSSKIPLLAKPAGPGLDDGLDVKPMPLRKAELSWNPVANANRYVVEVQASGGTWASPHTHTRIAPTTSLEIELDSILPDKGLADAPYAYEFRVIAKYLASGGDGTYSSNSAYSDMITVADTPIWSVNEDSRNAPSVFGLQGQALVKWDAIPGVTGHTIRHRLLQGNHSDTSWRPDDPTRADETQVDASETDHLITGLGRGSIYAIQFNYKTSSGWTYSGRDAYVWPSDVPPIRNKKVATYSFFGYWKDKMYRYTVCDRTFPDDPSTPDNESTQWENLITNAFGQWEGSAQDLNVVHTDEDCTLDNTVPISIIAAVNNGRNEVYVVDKTDWDTVDEWHVWRNFLYWCISGETPACVISARYWDPYWLKPFKPSVRALEVGGVDVLVNSRLLLIENKDQDIPGSDSSVSHDDVRFNECQIGPMDDDFYLYETMIHEAGHALGLSGFSYTGFLTDGGRYTMAHPTLPDSVMNYDWEVSENVYGGSWIRDEPDCSPHPLDIMAIQALYQTIDP